VKGAQVDVESKGGSNGARKSGGGAGVGAGEGKWIKMGKKKEIRDTFYFITN
jgi:hypothetical protein